MFSLNNKIKDPYLKPVIFGGLLTTLLSVIFAPGIFLWSIIGGYVTVRVSNRATGGIVSILDSLFLGLFSGILGGVCLDILTIVSFQSSESQRILIRTLKANWPKDTAPIPNFVDILPTLFLTTSILVVIITILFSIVGSYLGVLISRRK